MSTTLLNTSLNIIVTLIVALLIYIIGSFIINKVVNFLSRPVYLGLQKLSKIKVFEKAPNYQSLILNIINFALTVIMLMAIIDVVDIAILNTIVAGVVSFFADLVKIASLVVGGALALAFGLGGQDYAKKAITKYLPKIK